VYEGNDDCAISYLKPGFKALCWDSWLEMRWPLTNSVLSEYRWSETIRARGEDGKAKFIPNPKKPHVNKEGKEIHYHLELRDFRNNVLPPISFAYAKVNVSYMMPTIPSTLRISPDEKYFYVPCSRVGDHDSKFTTYERVCRVALNSNEGMDEVLSIHRLGDKGVIITEIEVAKNGDVFFTAGGSKEFPGIWKYEMTTKTFIQVTRPPSQHYDQSLRVSPDGQLIAFSRPDNDFAKLFIVALKGERK
jgi:hypothetical protein